MGKSRLGEQNTHSIASRVRIAPECYWAIPYQTLPFLCMLHLKMRSRQRHSFGCPDFEFEIVVRSTQLTLETNRRGEYYY